MPLKAWLATLSMIAIRLMLKYIDQPCFPSFRIGSVRRIDETNFRTLFTVIKWLSYLENANQIIYNCAFL